MTIEFTQCLAQHMKFGKMSPQENVNIDLVVFSLPEYFLYHEDPVIGDILYGPEMGKGFHAFQIINN